MDLLGLTALLAPGPIVPILGKGELRAKRADFLQALIQELYRVIRVRTPKDLLDEVERLYDCDCES